MSGQLSLLDDLNERLAEAGKKAPKPEPSSTDVGMLLAENARLREIVAKQCSELEALNQRCGA